MIAQTVGAFLEYMGVSMHQIDPPLRSLLETRPHSRLALTQYYLEAADFLAVDQRLQKVSADAHRVVCLIKGDFEYKGHILTPVHAKTLRTFRTHFLAMPEPADMVETLAWDLLNTQYWHAYFFLYERTLPPREVFHAHYFDALLRGTITRAGGSGQRIYVQPPAPEPPMHTGERVPRCQVCTQSLVHEPLAEICIVWPYMLGPESGKYSLLHKPCFAQHDQAEWGVELLDRFLNPAHGYTRKIPRSWVEAFARFWPPPTPQHKTSRAPRPSKTGSVYIIEAIGTGHYKIGYGINALERLRALQTGCPFPLRLVRDIRTTDKAGLEQRLHARYSNYRRLGEWFELPSAVLERLLQETFP